MTEPLTTELKPADPADPCARALCETRQDELNAALDCTADASPQTRHDIQLALDALDLVTGNLDPKSGSTWQS